MLTLDNLRKRYKTGDEALKGVSFSVSEGQVVGLIGPSGSGKSTLIRCINRLIEPTGGEIWFGNVALRRLNRRQLRQVRRRIGMIFQEYALVERLTVMENVLSGRLGYVSFWRSLLRCFPQSDVDQAFTLLDRVGLSEFADKRADELSGGQRQRVGIARALEQNPQLLLIDEPTASLDPRTSRQIMRLIGEICAERQLPAIINLHDVVLARSFTDRIIGLRQGEVVFDGSPDGLDDAALTLIYGEEDWTQMHRAVREEAEEAQADARRLDLPASRITEAL